MRYDHEKAMKLFKKFFKGLLITIASLAVIIYLFMLQPSFGRLPSGERKKRIENSPHYRNGSFQNLETTKLLADDASYVNMVAKFFSSDTIREPIKALPAIKSDLKAIPEDKPTLIWFGHSSYLISIGGKKILADPVFSQRASPMQYAGSKSYPGTMIFTPDDFPDLDVVVISHDHYDHLDYNTILKLKDKTKLFCVPLGIGEHLEKWDVDPAKIREFDWWESAIVLPGIELTATPARHFSGRGFTRNKTLWASFVVKISEYKIFIGGDSGYDKSFKATGEKFGPFDIAMLECGQYDKQWPNIHMMPEETVQASIDLGAKVFLPVHWAKFTLALHPWKEPIQRAVKRAESLHVKVTTPKIGEPIVLNQGLPYAPWWEE
jgi:L-ascorbate metabolism protein UlaG (beta-lactamase superfamily)